MMKEKIAIIGDIAGEFDCLMRLTAHLYEKGVTKIVLLGDLNDRGPNSKDVIEWAMKNETWVTTLHSNHGDMFVDFYKRIVDPDHWESALYSSDDFIRNGGMATLRSYSEEASSWIEQVGKVPREHITFLETRPLFFVTTGLICSHAPIHPFADVMVTNDMVHTRMERVEQVWNRLEPREIPGMVQVFGHNSHWGLRRFSENGEKLYALCIDTSRSRKLTAFIWPERELIEESF